MCAFFCAQVGKKTRSVEHVNAPFEVLYWKVRIKQLDDPRWPSLLWLGDFQSRLAGTRPQTKVNYVCQVLVLYMFLSCKKCHK